MNTSLQVKTLSSKHDLHVYGYECTGQSRDASQNLLIAKRKGFFSSFSALSLSARLAFGQQPLSAESAHRVYERGKGFVRCVCARGSLLCAGLKSCHLRPSKSKGHKTRSRTRYEYQHPRGGFV